MKEEISEGTGGTKSMACGDFGGESDKRFSKALNDLEAIAWIIDHPGTYQAKLSGEYLIRRHGTDDVEAVMAKARRKVNNEVFHKEVLRPTLSAVLGGLIVALVLFLAGQCQHISQMPTNQPSESWFHGIENSPKTGGVIHQRLSPLVSTPKK